MEKDRLNNENTNKEVNRKTPPRPPVIPKSYQQGVKPPVMKSSVQKDNDSTVDKPSYSKPIRKEVSMPETKHAEPNVVISKNNDTPPEDTVKSSSKSSSSYASYIDKKS